MSKKIKDSQSSFRPISSYSVLPAYFTLPFRRCSINVAFTLIRTVLHDFFWLQFSVKFGLKKIEVINVDHPLDAKVPFVPEKVDDYLSFVNYWIKPLSFMLKRFGEKTGIYYCIEYLKLITKCYREASRMYQFRMSTTVRPPVNHNKSFRLIHLWDPHYLCVPSLHIAIVILTSSFYKKYLQNEELSLSANEYTSYVDELYRGAVNIGETVLYIKQHSTNCIPAALYMMTRIIPDLFTIDDAIRFINDLFKNSTDILPEDKTAIIEHIHYLFERLTLEGCSEEDWVVPVQRWILKYKEGSR